MPKPRFLGSIEENLVLVEGMPPLDPAIKSIRCALHFFTLCIHFFTLCMHKCVEGRIPQIELERK